MGPKFVNIDRDTPMLLPADVQDWVPQDHLVRFILDAVDTLDLHGFKVNVRGTGSPQYPPSVLLSLLVYCYAVGLFSSRKIERATYEHLPIRFSVPIPTPITIPSARSAAKTRPYSRRPSSRFWPWRRNSKS